jgi:hypothetical protein
MMVRGRRDAFVRTAFWKAARGRFTPSINDADLPHDLLARFPGAAVTPMIALLRFLSPLTTRRPRSVRPAPDPQKS